jgi:hypothetical protein
LSPTSAANDEDPYYEICRFCSERIFFVPPAIEVADGGHNTSAVISARAVGKGSKF